VDGVGHGGFQAHGCNLAVAKIENAHKHLHPASEAKPDRSTESGLRHYARGATLVKKI
jgi:hypothetical protein